MAAPVRVQVRLTLHELAALAAAETSRRRARSAAADAIARAVRDAVAAVLADGAAAAPAASVPDAVAGRDAPAGTDDAAVAVAMAHAAPARLLLRWWRAGTLELALAMMGVTAARWRGALIAACAPTIVPRPRRARTTPTSRRSRPCSPRGLGRRRGRGAGGRLAARPGRGLRAPRRRRHRRAGAGDRDPAVRFTGRGGRGDEHAGTRRPRRHRPGRAAAGRPGAAVAPPVSPIGPGPGARPRSPARSGCRRRCRGWRWCRCTTPAGSTRSPPPRSPIRLALAAALA
ncbi:MAG: hypothetical protein H6709_11310 [Kofleriaceae bacterium]|nr:hypothetical protein [Kofleriaceae bacterium]